MFKMYGKLGTCVINGQKELVNICFDALNFNLHEKQIGKLILGIENKTRDNVSLKWATSSQS
jgi:hypothetical protein